MKVFNETQRFNQWWLISLMVFVMIIPFYGFYDKIVKAENTNDIEFVGHIITLVVVISSSLLVFSLKLKIRIDEKGITYQFFPIHFKSKKIDWSELEKCYVRKYSPMMEYGGWGIRGLRKNNGAYNVKGNMGVQLLFKNGRKLLFGTQEPEKVKRVISNYSTKLSSNSQ